jgi:predicted PurR-regulated permease PerM
VSEQQPPSVAPGPARRSPLPVPPLLNDLAGWTWRLLLLAGAGYALVTLSDKLYFVVLPLIVGLLATALAHPLVSFFRRRGLPRAAATWLTVVIAAGVIAGIFYLVVQRASDQYPTLVADLQRTVTSVENFLKRDLHIGGGTVNNLGNRITTYLQAHQSSIASSGVSVAARAGEVIAGVVLWFFITFFFLYDGDNIWDWIVGLVPPGGRERMRGAGDKAWARVAGFVRGTFLIALIHGLVAGISLEILRVPLVLPLALLVFVGSFIPIVGALAFGGLAVLITFVTRGAVPGIVFIGILVVDNQVEAHILQPFLVGRYVRLHPLVVAISIAGGSLLEGLPGAILAVPFVAVSYAVAKYLFIGEDEALNEEVPPGEDDDAPPAEDRLVPEVST